MLSGCSEFTAAGFAWLPHQSTRDKTEDFFICAALCVVCSHSVHWYSYSWSLFVCWEKWAVIPSDLYPVSNSGWYSDCLATDKFCHHKNVTHGESTLLFTLTTVFFTNTSKYTYRRVVNNGGKCSHISKKEHWTAFVTTQVSGLHTYQPVQICIMSFSTV